MNTAQLNALSIAELIALNTKIVAIVKEKQRMNNRTASFEFMPGHLVNYTSNKFGGRESGKVLEVKRTKVLVEVAGRGRVLVPASMLRHGA
jgi:hypothetical protein